MSPTSSSAGLSLGQLAPDFTLTDETGKRWSLSALRGQPVLLIFYPGDMTPGCTVQLCAIRDDWAKFAEAKIQVLGINHGDAESHKSFADKHKFPFPLLVDADKQVSKKYGTLYGILGLRLIRRTVVGIDGLGMVVYLKAGMPKDADILKAFNVK